MRTDLAVLLLPSLFLTTTTIANAASLNEPRGHSSRRDFCGEHYDDCDHGYCCPEQIAEYSDFKCAKNVFPGSVPGCVQDKASGGFMALPVGYRRAAIKEVEKLKNSFPSLGHGPKPYPASSFDQNLLSKDPLTKESPPMEPFKKKKIISASAIRKRFCGPHHHDCHHGFCCPRISNHKFKCVKHSLPGGIPGCKNPRRQEIFLPIGYNADAIHAIERIKETIPVPEIPGNGSYLHARDASSGSQSGTITIHTSWEDKQSHSVHEDSDDEPFEAESTLEKQEDFGKKFTLEHLEDRGDVGERPGFIKITPITITDTTTIVIDELDREKMQSSKQSSSSSKTENPRVDFTTRWEEQFATTIATTQMPSVPGGKPFFEETVLTSSTIQWDWQKSKTMASPTSSTRGHKRSELAMKAIPTTMPSRGIQYAAEALPDLPFGYPGYVIYPNTTMDPRDPKMTMRAAGFGNSKTKHVGRTNLDPALACGSSYVDCKNGWCCPQGSRCEKNGPSSMCRADSDSVDESQESHVMEAEKRDKKEPVNRPNHDDLAMAAHPVAYPLNLRALPSPPAPSTNSTMGSAICGPGATDCGSGVCCPKGQVCRKFGMTTFCEDPKATTSSIVFPLTTYGTRYLMPTNRYFPAIPFVSVEAAIDSVTDWMATHQPTATATSYVRTMTTTGTTTSITVAQVTESITGTAIAEAYFWRGTIAAFPDLEAAAAFSRSLFPSGPVLVWAVAAMMGFAGFWAI